MDRSGPRLQPFGPEPHPPRVPAEPWDEEGHPDDRTVSPRVSLHPSLLLHDVVNDDGAYVGRNRDGTVGPPTLDEDGPGQVCYLNDMADIRNHRHHGLIGALVVLPGDCTPLDPVTGEESWTGVSARVRTPGDEEDPALVDSVLFLQDGLRHFVAGDPRAPLPDAEPGIDPVDAGQKGINYRSARPGRDLLHDETPPTPILRARTDDTLWLRVVGACDKPRNHTFTLHGTAWRFAPWVAESGWTGSVSGISAASAHDLVVSPEAPGDHAYRTGVFRWHLNEGMWGILRIDDNDDNDDNDDIDDIDYNDDNDDDNDVGDGNGRGKGSEGGRGGPGKGEGGRGRH